MNCKKIFTKDVLFKNCTDKFISTDLKNHRENVLLNEQKSFMPMTQVYVSLEKDKDKIRENIKVLEYEKSLILEQLHIKQTSINNMLYNINHMTVSNETVETERKNFVRKCPITDCRGFLSTQWKCGICEIKICNKCNEQKENDEHICNPENVATMELLNKDTKPCPECGTMIHRYTGCPMMFCVECHCAWNWNTGRVEKGVIHNPHYYEFIRNGGTPGRNHGDIPCGGLPHIHQLRNIINNSEYSGIITKIQSKNLYNIHNIITHIQNYEIRQNIELGEEQTRQLRIEYMLNKISEENFKKVLQQNEKQLNKKRDFNNIYQMFVDVASDIFRQIVVDYTKTKTFTFLVENIVIFENLRNYFNENIKKTGKSYKCVYPGINELYVWQYNYEAYLKREKNLQDN